MLKQIALEELKNAIREVAGEGSAREILFRLGRMIGERRAERLIEPNEIESALENGLGQLQRLGIGEIEVRELEYKPSAHLCRLRAKIVLDPLEAGADSPDSDFESATCGVAAGYVTGLLAGMTGCDLVCDWLACPRKNGEPVSDPGEPCCSFEVRLAYLGPPVRADGVPERQASRTRGTAHFYLGDVGTSLGSGEISLEDLVESTDDAIVMLDLDDIVRFWNRGAERMFGYTRSEVVGESCGVLLPEDLRGGREQKWLAKQVEKKGGLSNHITRRVTKDGRELIVSMTRTSLHNSSGEVMGSTTVLRDETERRRIEEDLERARHLAIVGEMAATVAHDIKNPLAAIYAAVQYLGRGKTTEQERQEILESIGKEVFRVDETIQDLLRYSRPLPPKLESVPVLEFVNGVLAEMDLKRDLRQHDVQVEIDPNLTIPMDRGMLARTVRNLLINAGQAMSDPGKVSLIARLDGEFVTLEVSDTGGGVPDELVKTLFEPFITSKARGTGLGLPIARRNVESHGGLLDLHYTGKAGSAFRLQLPVTASLASPILV